MGDPSRTPADYDFEDFPAGQLQYTGYFDVDAGEFGGDDLYLIPGIHSGSAMLFYRKDLLEAAGIPVPTTWADYLEAAKQLTKDGVVGNVNTGNATDPTLFLVDWYTRFITMGGQMTSGSKADKTLRTNLDSPEAIAALQNLIDLLPYSPEGIPTYGFGEALPKFTTGAVAMWPTWATIASYLFNPDHSGVADKVAVAPMPAEDGNPRAIRGGWGLGIPTNIPQANRDAAWHILTYLTSKEHEKCQVLNYQTDPNRISTATDPDVLAKYPFISDSVKAIESAQVLEFANIPETFEIITAVARELNLALAGSQDAETAMKNAQPPRWRSSSGAGTWPSSWRPRAGRHQRRGLGLTAAAPSQTRGIDDRPGARPGGHPLHTRRDIAVLLAPTAVYLLAFSILPLIYSLAITFFEWSQTARSFTFVGLDNFGDILADPVFWQAAANTAVLTTVSVAIQVVLGTALALFFDLHPRGSWFVRGVLILPMLLTPVVVGLMWRALLNPDWGVVNWVLGELGLAKPLWTADPGTAILTLIVVDSWQRTPFVMVIVFARLQALPRDVFEAASVDGARWRQTLTHITLPLLAPAIAFAAIFRAIDAFRAFDVVFGLTYGGPGRLTTTLSFYAWENGFTFSRYGYASALAYVMVVVASIAMAVLVRFFALRKADAL